MSNQCNLSIGDMVKIIDEDIIAVVVDIEYSAIFEEYWIITNLGHDIYYYIDELEFMVAKSKQRRQT